MAEEPRYQPVFPQGYASMRSSVTSVSNRQSPYPTNRLSSAPDSVAGKFSLGADPSQWNVKLSPKDGVEADDELHDPRRGMDNGSWLTFRGLANLGCLAILALGLLALFAGYPIASHFVTKIQSTNGGFNIGGINATGQVPEMSHGRGLIDPETPSAVYTKKSIGGRDDGGDNLQLVFSDEFNTDGRTFYPGDDPYWEAVVHYWGTNNLEWYDPRKVQTKDGAMEITLNKENSHDLEYEGGMVSTWNKFCFTGGLVEVSVVLPGAPNVRGLWPAVWTMGNLGRAGYGATLDGTWPYSYDSCDVGTVANQSVINADGIRVPTAAATTGERDGILSYLPGQKLSRCTCPGESHPGPIHADGTYVGRSAPEIDIFEAQVGEVQGVLSGHVSASGQWAPFNADYSWFNESNALFPDPATAHLNEYRGGAFQQTTSGVVLSKQECYQLSGGCFSVYGFEYKTGFDDGYISWIVDDKKSWVMLGPGTGPDSKVEIGARPVPFEPMYLLANLGISLNFGTVDFDQLVWPAVMKIDWVRVYQPKNAINIGCDPVDFPTAAYIDEYKVAYNSPNLTTWVDDFKQKFPKNSFLGEC